MTISILDNKKNKSQASELLPGQDGALESNSGASGVLNRAERTPGAVAVSRVIPRQDVPGQTENLPRETRQTNSRGGCGAWAILAECESGQHHFAKKLFCGKEWCPDCGKDRSPAHNRRISRILCKASQIDKMGYFVIEFPKVYRHIGQQGLEPEPVLGWCYSKRDLRETSNIIVNVLAGKRMGRRGRVGGYFKRGLVRWHWFGDENPGKWNPHANVLVDGAYIDNDTLEEIKAALRQALNVPDLIVNYGYCDTPGQKFHRVEYVTRATFKEESWNPYMARELYNFRNMRWWGSWHDEPVWNLTQVEDAETTGLMESSQLQQGVCPDCGRPLKTIGHGHDGKAVQWTRPVDSGWLVIWGAQEIGDTGYYRIPHSEWHGGGLSPSELMGLEELDHRAQDNPSVRYVAVLARELMKLRPLAAKQGLSLRQYLKKRNEVDI